MAIRDTVTRLRHVPTRSSITDSPTDLANHLHSAAIHLLRRVRGQDEASGLRAPALSVLSVIVYRGPISLGELAVAEGVRPPTITRVVEGLERAALVVRRADAHDRRVTRVSATARGRSVLERARARRIAALASELASLSASDRALLARAVEIIEAIVGPPS